MRIGVMLRHVGEHGGGVNVYTRRVLTEMLRIPSGHEFVFFYRQPEQAGQFGAPANLREVVVGAPAKLAWDQIAVPLASRREKVDLLFNPKYSLPLVRGQPGVFVLHGIDNLCSMTWGNKWQDRLSHKFLIPRYVHRASRIICVSASVRREVLDLFEVSAERVSTVYYGVDDAFFEEDSPGAAEATRERLGLTGPYFLYAGQIYPPKNMMRLLEAFARVGPPRGIRLAIAGEPRWLCEQEMARMEEADLAPWITRAGWCDRPTLRALYRGARALVLPSLYEGFGLPIVEAMAAGCPIITSNRWSMKELAEDASVLVEPEDIDSIVGAMATIAGDESLRQQLVERGRERVKAFDWARCAAGTLRVLEAAAQGCARPARFARA